MKLAIGSVSILIIIFTSGCVDPGRVDNLEKRVSALETQLKQKQTADSERRQKLENCVKFDADLEYWSVVRLNGKEKSGGTYSAPQWVWQWAERKKKDKIEECKLLYGG